MECLELNTQAERGKIIQMTKDNKKRQKNNQNSNNSIPQEVPSKKKSAFEIASLVATIIVSIFSLGIFGFIMEMNGDIRVLTEKVDQQSEKVNTMYNHIYIDDNNMDDRLIKLEEQLNKLNIKTINVTDSSTISFIDALVMQNTANVEQLDVEKIIGVDIAGESCYVKDLINQTVLLTYIEGDKEVYFLGQYNELLHWDGYCVTNAYYKNGKLYGICEANFDDKIRTEYKSFCHIKDDEWVLSERTSQYNINIGTSSICNMEYDKEKNFTNTNVRFTDVLYVDSFIASNDAKIRQFYDGRTSNERYSDDTGSAYLAIFDSDGTVKTLYVGKFKNGEFSDNSGNAWDIAYSEETKSYYYNKGRFENNKFVGGLSEKITNEEIEEVIAKYNFSCFLRWKQL